MNYVGHSVTAAITQLCHSSIKAAQTKCKLIHVMSTGGLKFPTDHFYSSRVFLFKDLNLLYITQKSEDANTKCEIKHTN